MARSPLGVRAHGGAGRPLTPASRHWERWGRMTFRDVAARAGAPTPPRGFPTPSGHAGLRAQARRRVPSLAGERCHLDARRRRCRHRATGWSRPISAAPCNSFATRSARPAGDRMAGLAAVRRAFYRGRRRARDPRAPAGERRAAKRRRTWRPSAARSCLRSPAASASTARVVGRFTPAARGARGRSCWKHSPSPRRRASARWSTARTRTSMRWRRP